MVHINSRRKRPENVFFLVACFLTPAAIGGCKASYEEANTEAASHLVASAATETQIQQSSQAFIKQIQSRNLNQAESYLMPDLRKKMTTNQLDEATKKGILQPLSKGMNFRYEPVHVNAKGSRATLRFMFDTTQQKDYHMNFVFEKMGADWKIATLIPPVKHGTPMDSRSGTASEN